MEELPQSFSHFPHIPPVARLPLIQLQDHVCGYLPPRIARSRGTLVSRLDPNVYHALMDAGFRRSGRLVYQPVCVGCRACTPLRVPTDTFYPTKAQRRAARQNLDLTVTVSPPKATREKFDLYARYTAGWHGRADEASPDEFVSFLYDSPVETVEFHYRLNGTLIGVGLCDVCARRSLSSVYFYFDPDHAARSLGTMSILREIDYARANAIPHYYLGFWIRDCAAMNYKAHFQPAERLEMDGVWRRFTQ